MGLFVFNVRILVWYFEIIINNSNKNLSNFLILKIKVILMFLDKY